MKKHSCAVGSDEYTVHKWAAEDINFLTYYEISIRAQTRTHTHTHTQTHTHTAAENRVTFSSIYKQLQTTASFTSTTERGIWHVHHQGEILWMVQQQSSTAFQSTIHKECEFILRKLLHWPWRTMCLVTLFTILDTPWLLPVWIQRSWCYWITGMSWTHIAHNGWCCS